MPISSIQIHNFRNIKEAQLLCSDSLNIFYGMNAAGKTSLLEAIYFLSTTKSFRTNQLDTMTIHGDESFSVSASYLEDNIDTPMGIQRHLGGNKQIRLNQQTIPSIVAISRYLPTQFIGTNSQSLLSEGPKIRRQFLDWGLFHTNSDFYPAWKAFQKILAHRNAAIKARASKNEINAWNQSFVATAEQLDGFRRNYIHSFSPCFTEIMSVFLPGHHIEFNYFSGWSNEKSLADHLIDTFFREQQAGFSLFGPQRAELEIFVEKHPAYDVLSQGQQKLLSYALRIAQGIHLLNSTGKSPIFLIDDLPSELDHEKRSLVFNLLSRINAQVFVTAIDPDQITPTSNMPDSKLFHVKHGDISPA